MTTKLSGYSTTPGSNNAAVPDGWPEGMLPGDVNACAREMMARLREWYDDPAWINRGDTATSYTASSISVSGDQTSQYVAGRPIRLDGSSYGYVTGSAYSAPNTSVAVSGITVSATPTVMELGILSASSQMLGSVSLATLTVTGTLTVSGTTILGTATSLGTATTAVTAADGDNSTKVATTAYADTRVSTAFTANQSVSANGYQKFPGGLIIQWGQTGTITAASSSAVSFPVTFTTAVYSVVATRNDAAVNAQRSDATYSITTTGFTVDNGSPSNAARFSWMAVGK